MIIRQRKDTGVWEKVWAAASVRGTPKTISNLVSASGEWDRLLVTDPYNIRIDEYVAVTDPHWELVQR